MTKVDINTSTRLYLVIESAKLANILKILSRKASAMFAIRSLRDSLLFLGLDSKTEEAESVVVAPTLQFRGGLDVELDSLLHRNRCPGVPLALKHFIIRINSGFVIMDQNL